MRKLIILTAIFLGLVALKNAYAQRYQTSLTGYQVLTSAAAATPVDASLGDNCLAALTENTTVGAPTNPRDGQVLTFKFTNTASNRTVAFNAVFHCVAGSCPTITTGAKDSMIAFKYDLTGTVWNELYRALNE